MPRIIDLSKPIQYNSEDPFFMRVKVKNQPHGASKNLIRWFLGLPKKLWPDNFTGWANDSFQMGVHSVTHIDAPWHYSPTVNGEPAKTIDQVPLEWCFGDGIVIDMSHKEDNDPITIADLEADLEKTGTEIKPGNIVLIRTDRDKFIGTKEYPDRGTGMSKEATEWLIDKGVKVMGIDQWGWDLPLRYQVKRAKETGDKNLFWEAHLVGQHREYCHMEQLVNLKALPPFGFKVCVFPLKIVGGSAAPARVVAIMDE